MQAEEVDFNKKAIKMRLLNLPQMRPIVTERGAEKNHIFEFFYLRVRSRDLFFYRTGNNRRQPVNYDEASSRESFLAIARDFNEIPRGARDASSKRSRQLLPARKGAPRARKFPIR